MIYLQNNLYKIGLLQLGAELRSVINKSTQKEYIWQADASVWNRSSPVLFPFVGRLKNDQYTYKGKTYHLPQHGFARNFDFEVISQTETKIIFELTSNNKTLENYPFHFNLQLQYELVDNALQLTYRIENTGAEVMYYSLGAHPAFLLEKDVETYSIEFEEAEQFQRHLLNSGLQTHQTDSVPMNANILPLKKEFFEVDAIVLKGMKSKVLSIIDENNNKTVSLEASHFPYYGIWSKSPFPFICLEPWDGIADSVDSTGELTEKEGIQSLLSSEIVLRRITFRFF